VFTQALVIVNVLAPNALAISLSDPVTRDIQVPTLALSSPEDDTIAVLNAISTIPAHVLTDVRIVPKWEVILQPILLYPPEMNWDIPQGCGITCYFKMEYDGLALQCRDVTSDEYHLILDLYTQDFLPEPQIPFYMTNSTTEINRNYDITINYA